MKFFWIWPKLNANITRLFFLKLLSKFPNKSIFAPILMLKYAWISFILFYENVCMSACVCLAVILTNFPIRKNGRKTENYNSNCALKLTRLCLGLPSTFAPVSRNSVQYIHTHTFSQTTRFSRPQPRHRRSLLVFALQFCRNSTHYF